MGMPVHDTEVVQPNLDNIRAWVAALRSGEFQQGRGALIKQQYDGSKLYCCLGVACEVAMVAGVELPYQWIGDQATFAGGNSGVLPRAVQLWLGLPNNPQLQIPVELISESFRALLSKEDTHFPDNAISANDHWRLTFEQIADIVEATYLREEPQHGDSSTDPE